MTSNMRMSPPELRCIACSAPAPSPHFGPCPTCGVGGLEVDQDLAGGTLDLASRPTSIWHYASLLPQVPETLRLSLGEGGTPVVEASVGGRTVFVKNEGMNPSLSFKDRFNAVNISVARALGYVGVILSSTGNAGMAAASYGARAGLAVRVLCPINTPGAIVRSMRALGAEVLLRDPSEHRPALHEGLAQGFFPGSRGYPFDGVSPFGAEGYKTIAYEIAAVLGTPDVVYVPLGGGDGLFGIHKGFRELRDLGLSDTVPQMVGVHAAVPWAVSIASDQHGTHALDAIQRSGGHIVNVTAEELTLAMRELARAALLVEPASAASAAGLAQDVARHHLPPEALAVCVVTSNLAKWWDHVEDGIL